MNASHFTKIRVKPGRNLAPAVNAAATSVVIENVNGNTEQEEGITGQNPVQQENSKANAMEKKKNSTAIDMEEIEENEGHKMKIILDNEAMRTEDQRNVTVVQVVPLYSIAEVDEGDEVEEDC